MDAQVRDAAGVRGRGPARWLSPLQPPRREDTAGLCRLDATSLRSLEVLATIRGGTGTTADGVEIGDGSLCGVFAPSKVFPGCRTAMAPMIPPGARAVVGISPGGSGMVAGSIAPRA